MPRPPSRTTWGQRILLLGFAAFLLLGLELAVRLVGFGGTPPLVLPFLDEPESLFEVNPALAAPFFARRAPDGSETVGAHRRELVRLPKEQDTLRVLFLGASSVEGFPLPRNLTAARFLERILDDAVTEHRVEVINLGVTAIASFPVRVLGERAIDQLDPDLVVVYAGHNELFGASGVASRQYLGRSTSAMRWIYRLRRTGVGQLLQEVLMPPPENHGEQRRNLIELMADIELIEPQGELHQAARKTLVENLESLVSAARRERVPIVLSTLVSLERGLHPIASWFDRPEVQETFDQELGTAVASIGEDPRIALRSLDGLLAREPRHAGTVYRRAETLWLLGRREEAVEEFRRARDLDAMPWRAPADRNADIRSLADRLGVPLAEPQSRFAAVEGGATTWELFYDHVHPSLRGQALLASAIAEPILEGGLLGSANLTQEGAADWTEIARELGAHPLESYLALHKMKTLFETPPIGTHNRDVATRIEAVLERQSKRWDAVDRKAVKLWTRMSQRAGFTMPISYPAARAALTLGERHWARSYAVAAVANAYPLSDQRCAAQLALVESTFAGTDSFDPADFDEALREALTEVAVVSTTPSQPTPLLAAVRARLLTLAGEDDTMAWEQADQLAKGTKGWVRAYLTTLPSRNVYERLADYRGEFDGALRDEL